MATKTAAVNLNKVSFHQLKKFYQDYCIDGATFRTQAGAAIRMQDGLLLTNAKHATTNTCALRLSYALHRAGVMLPHVAGHSATYIGKHRSPAFLPTVAEDYKNILNGEQKIKPNNRLMLNGRAGIILFLAGNEQAFGATGHITLFEGVCTVDGTSHYFGDSRVTSIWYWDVPR